MDYLSRLERLHAPKAFGEEVIGSTPIFSTFIKLSKRIAFFIMTYCCYIIYSAKLDRYYVGHTEDIDIRLTQHNSGISKFTSKANDWLLVYQQLFTTREGARKRENEIKKKKSRKYIEWIILAG